ncbi:MAG: hypothetical protein AAF645_27630, partial [Myxococcota bacterium]
MADEREDSTIERRYFRGVLVNVFGLVAKVLIPAFLIVVTRLLGTDVAGTFVTLLFVVEVVRSLVVVGYGDAVMVFGSRVEGRMKLAKPSTNHDAPEDPVPLIRGTLVTAIGLSLLIAIGLWLLAPVLGERVYPQLEGFTEGLRWMVLALPAMAIMTVSLAATKIQQRMEFDVLVEGFLVPAGLIAACVWAWSTETGLVALAQGYAAAYALGALASLLSVSKDYSLARVFSSSGTYEPGFRDVHRFAVPHSLKQTLNQYQTRVDVLLLGAFGTAS